MKTLHQNVLTIKTDHDITNTGELIVFVEFVREMQIISGTEYRR